MRDGLIVHDQFRGALNLKGHTRNEPSLSCRVVPGDKVDATLIDLTLPRRTLVYLALTTLGVSQPLLQLYGNNLAVFTAAGWSGAIVVVFAVCAVLVPPAVLAAVDAALSAVPRVPARRVHLGIVWEIGRAHV